jgi:hypothetical protein
MVFIISGGPVPGIGDFEISFPWAGAIQQVQANARLAGTAGTAFYVERQAKADYIAQANNWQRVADQLFILPAGDVYVEIPVAEAITAGDMFRLNFVDGDATDLTIQIYMRAEE